MYKIGFTLLLVGAVLAVAASPAKSFLRNDTAYITGNIKDYKGENGVIYYENILWDESYPLVVEFSPNGDFFVPLPLSYPVWNEIVLKEQPIPFYVCPGDTLVITAQYTGQGASPLAIQYSGKQTEMNEGLRQAQALKLKNVPYPEEEITDSVRDNYALQIEQAYRNYITQLQQLSREQGLSPEVRQLSANAALMSQIIKLLNLDRQVYDMWGETPEDPATDPYYRLLKEIPWNDITLMSDRNFPSFIQLFDFSTMLHKKWRLTDKAQLFFLTQKKVGYPFTADEKKLEKYFRKNPVNPDSSRIQDLQLFQQKYQDSSIFGTAEVLLVQNLLFHQDMRLKPGIIWEIINLRRLPVSLTYAPGRKVALQQRDFVIKQLKNPFLIQIANRLTESAFPADTDLHIFMLPEGRSADVFHRIIDPYKGKVLLIDIWATWCSPCLAGIENMEPVRKKYENRNVGFIFVSSEKNSPVAAFNRVMEKVNGYKFRLKEEDYRYLCQAFKINSIPHYILVDASGKIVDPDFRLTNVETVLDKLLK